MLINIITCSEIYFRDSKGSFVVEAGKCIVKVKEGKLREGRSRIISWLGLCKKTGVDFNLQIKTAKFRSLDVCCSSPCTQLIIIYSIHLVETEELLS